MQQRFEGQFTITKKDNRRFNFFHMRRKLIVTAIIVFLVIFGMLSVVRIGQGMEPQEAVLRALGMATAGVVLLVGVNLVSALIKINRLYKTKQLSDFTVTFIVDKAGVHAKSDRGDSDIPWARIALIKETRNAFYLFLTDNYANVIPKDQLKSPADLETLRALFRLNLDKRRCKVK